MSTELALHTHQELFQPIPKGAIEGLLQERDRLRASLTVIYNTVRGDLHEGAVDYFFKGTSASSVYDAFNLERAQKALDVDFWGKAMAAADLYSLLPEKRRQEWEEQLQSDAMPAFTEDQVVPTLAALLAERPKFLAERVDGVFTALSPDHVTNSPWGFSKKMILAGVTDKYSFTCARQCGHINDLRWVIGKLMGRGEPAYNSTRYIISALGRDENTGEWRSIDGGAMRLKVYKKGTCHIEVHPDMAWRLNAILAHLHPRAIPSEHRRPPARKDYQEVELLETPIPFSVMAILEEMYSKLKHSNIADRTLRMPYHYKDVDKHTRQAVASVMEALGAVYVDGKFQFGYPVRAVLEEVVLSGALPDVKSHQYYPTPDHLAREMVAWAAESWKSAREPGSLPDSILEPSAGTGAIVDVIEPANHIDYRSGIHCVEVSSVRAAMLREKGYNVDCADFLEWAAGTQKFDLAVMNPPFSEKRWYRHVMQAFSLLHPGGVLVALIPDVSNWPGAYPGDCATVEGRGPFTYPGVSIKVRMVRMVKKSF